MKIFSRIYILYIKVKSLPQSKLADERTFANDKCTFMGLNLESNTFLSFGILIGGLSSNILLGYKSEHNSTAQFPKDLT